MAGDRYNIDDILNEVGSRRSRDNDVDDDFTPKTARTVSKSTKSAASVTEILDSTDIRTAAQKKKEEPKTGKQLSKMSITQILNSDELKRNHSARQMTDEESEARLASDISRAMEQKRKKQNKFRIEDSTLDIEKQDNSDNSDNSDDDDYIKLFVGSDKPDAQPTSNANDDIVFHNADEFVPTDTMQLRKQKKIDDINEALLRIDSEADSPDDMLDSINPMESRQKAVEIVKSGENTNEFQFGRSNTDTFTVSPYKLKKLSHGEHVREYPSRSSANYFSEEPDEKSIEFNGIQNNAAVSAEIHLGDSILDALNKKIAEEVNSPKNDSTAESVKITSEDDTLTGETTNETNELDKIRQADELARKKKLKIANFILENHDTEEIAPPSSDYSEGDYEYEDEDENEPLDLDDEHVIKDRLDHASKGLVGRMLILAALFLVTLFVAVVNALEVDLKMGFLTSVISRRAATDNYLYTHLVIGILSFSACSSVVSNGFSRLFKLRPDGDTLCALSHTVAIASIIPNLIGGHYLLLGHCDIYLLISLGSLLCNTLSKLLTVSTAKRNFNFIYRDGAKFTIDRCDKENELRLAKGVVTGVPNIGTVRKTEMLYDFIISTYSEDASDRMSKKLVPGVIIAAVVGFVVAFFTHTTGLMGESVSMINRISWAVSVMSAIFALGASFSSSMTVTLPIYLASRKNKKRGSAILGYNAAAAVSELNGVLVEARTLFPADSVRITNICGYDKPKLHGESRISIDESIIYAASLAMASDSILADAFFSMLNKKRELLKDVSDCIYENNLGIMGWIDRQRVLLGNRQHMKSHEITVPNLKKETAANVNNDEVIYLAVGGEVCLLFFIRLKPNNSVKKRVQALADNGVSLIVKTVDGIITDAEIAQQFDIEANKVKILPFDSHETFVECTKFVPRGKAAVSCNGTFNAFADTVSTAHKLRARAFISNVVQLGGVALGILLAVIFGLFAKFELFDMMIILLYNTVFGIAAIGAQFLKR